MLLHGYLSSKESFYYQTEFLGRYFRVYAPDLPGFGSSDGLCEPWSVGDYAAWLIRFADALRLGGVYILAHSFGARVAFKALSMRPSLASKLAVTGGAGIVKPRSPQYIRRVNAYRRIKKLFPAFAERHFGSAEYRSLSPLMKESYKKIVNEDLSECAAGITCPVYLLYGREDAVTPPSEEGRIFHGLIENSVFETMEGGHFCFSEHPDAFNAKIIKFFTER